MPDPAPETVAARTSALRAAVAFTLAAALACAGAVAIAFAGGHGPPTSLRVALAAAFALTCVAAPLATRDRLRGAGTAAILFAGVWAWWLGMRPAMTRDWTPPHAVQPAAARDGDLVTLTGVRDFRYRTESTWQARWHDVTVDLRTLDSVDLVLTRFSDVAGVGHVMASFRFSPPDGPPRHLVVSVEARREAGETYHPLGGLFRQYELIYVIAEEVDAIGARAAIADDPTWVIPLDVTREGAQAFFIAMIERAGRLAERPEWYNTFSSSCATNLADHYASVSGRRLGLDHRVVLPGFSDELIAELGLLPPGVTVEAARSRFLVNARARAAGASPDFSSRIRSPL